MLAASLLTGVIGFVFGLWLGVQYALITNDKDYPENDEDSTQIVLKK
jgi:hypothetical protein